MKQEVWHGDCLQLMKDIPDKSIDMVLCDLPYGTTACKWDTIIPFEPLWEQYKRIIKDNGAIVLTASQPFTSALVMSNVKMFKYEWMWEKEQGLGNLNAKKRPLMKFENVLVFYKNQPTYNPQMTTGKPYTIKRNKNTAEFLGKNGTKDGYITENKGERYPINILKYNRELKCRLHPTQKPVALFEYLIKTYTNEGDVVLDNCAGSGTTGVACQNLNRQFILIEKEQEYIDIINARLSLTN
jgi:site-specific DNA-methyltransferase (adenine-specific)